MIYKIKYDYTNNQLTLIDYEIVDYAPINVLGINIVNGIGFKVGESGHVYVDLSTYSFHEFIEPLLEQIRTIENRSNRLKNILNNDL
jgi:hypothetical protein